MINFLNKVSLINSMKNTLLLRLSSFFLLFLLSSCQRSSTPLKMLVMPIGSVENTRSTYSSFVSHLEDSVNRKVDLITPSTYAEVKDALVSESTFDVINLNGVLYSQYYDPERYQIFAQETLGGQSTYNSMFIARRSSNIYQTSDIKGKLLALDNKYSTSGGLVPVLMLMNDNLYPNSDYKIQFLNSHFSAAQSVIRGDSDVAAVSWKTLRKLIRDKKVVPNSLRIVAVSFPIPLDPWILNNNLSTQLKTQITNSFFNLSNESVMRSLGSDGFVPATPQTYSSLKPQDSELYRSVIGE